MGQVSRTRSSVNALRQILDQYVDAGILEKNVTIALCALYQHRTDNVGQIDEEALRRFDAHAWRIWSPSYDLELKLIEHALDRLVPKQVDPRRFTEYGGVLPSIWVPPQIHPKPDPNKPSLLSQYGLT